jgi:hypothetical protein
MGTLIKAMAAATLAASALAVAAPSTPSMCSAASGARLLPLVELYTSEGCSSCPPADRWLSSHFAGDTPGAAIVAFHVDYWNDLGWRDRFSSPAFTDRQHRVAAANGLTFVYTPQVVVQGRSVRDWRDDVAAIAATRDRPAAASIAIRATRAGGALDVDARASVPATRDRGGVRLYVALTSDGLESAVKAGENSGVTLHHDGVVRALREGPGADAAGALALSTRFALPADGHAPKIVAFVQDPARGDVLQSLVLPVDSCQP